MYIGIGRILKEELMPVENIGVGFALSKLVEGEAIAYKVEVFSLVCWDRYPSGGWGFAG